MPFLIMVAGAIAAAVFWMYRARSAGHVATELAGAAADVLNAARRFGFQRKANTHPVEGIDKPELAVGAIGVAFIELDSMPGAEQKKALRLALHDHLDVPADKAEEIMILGHWLVTQSNGPVAAVERLSKRLYRLGGATMLDPLMKVLNAVAMSGGGKLSDRQRDALTDIARHLRPR